MAIQKIKRATKQNKRKAAGKIEAAPGLEEKRKEFQDVASGKSQIITAAPAPKHHSASRRTLIIVVGALLAVFGTTAVVYAYFWYQSPDKVVMDAVMNSVTAKSARYDGKVFLLGSQQPQIMYSGAFGEGKTKLDVKVSMPRGSELSELNASTVATKDDLYLKIDQASRLIGETAPPVIRKTFEPHMSLIKDEVDGKWLRVNPGDIDMYQPITHVSHCAVSVFRLLTTDDSAARTIGGIYLQHPFFRVSESTRPTESIGKYALTLDTIKYDQFKERLYGSKFYASLAACNRQAHDVKAADLDGLLINLTIDKSKRELTDVTITQGTSFTSKLTLTPKFNETVNIETPTNVAKIGDIQAKAFRNTVKDLLKTAQ